ncbi:MAG TPA: glycosyltransferase [Thermoleophilaceae bacterium]
MKVAVVAEYYPRRRDPVLGVWAHRQALAARDAGADVKVLVLERPVPPSASLRRPWKLPGALAEIARQPKREELDGIEVRYVRFVAGDRSKTYATWHERAAEPLGAALAQLHAQWPIDVVHAHYALPAGGAALPFTREHGLPLVVSVHGGDVLGPLLQTPDARAAVGDVLARAAEVICNSRATLERVAGITLDEERLRVVHLGASPPEDPPPKRTVPTVATLGHVIPRKRHADVLEAVQSMDGVEWLVIGDGPELPALRRAAADLKLRDRIEFAGQLAPAAAIRELATTHAMALPSEDEAFGVAYVEALACGVPAIGLETEGGPAEIAACGPGMLLVPPRDPVALAAAIERALADPELPAQARRTAAEHFSWQRCGRDTVAAYRDALAG